MRTLSVALACCVGVSVLAFLSLDLQDPVLVWTPQGHPVTAVSASRLMAVANTLADMYQRPLAFVVLEESNATDTRRWTPSQDDRPLDPSCRLTVQWRPLVGDHVHLSWTVETPSGLWPMPHDRPVLEDEPYDTYGKGPHCLSNATSAYTKVWPHTGVHTHCFMGAIHVHPYSAPRVFRKEGLEVTLGLFFDSIGIRYHSAPVRIKSCDPCPYLTSNASHHWVLYQWFDGTTGAPDRVWFDYLDRVWLVDAYSSLLLRYASRDAAIPPRPEGNIKEALGKHAFQGEYPDRGLE